MKKRTKEIILLFLFLIILESLYLFFNSRITDLIGVDIYFHYDLANAVLNNFPDLPLSIPMIGEKTLFGYSPLAYFSMVCLNKLSGLSLINIMKYLPGIALFFISINLYVYFRLINKRFAFIRTLIFIINPLVFTIFFFVGSIGRILALFFLSILLILIEKYLRRKKRSYVLLMGFVFGLIILTHIIAAYISGGILAYLFLVNYFNKKETDFCISILIGLVIAGPWLIHIFLNFGIFYLVKIFFVSKYSLFAYLSLLIILIILFYHLKNKKLPDTKVILFILSLVTMALDIFSIAISIFFPRKGLKRLNKYKVLCSIIGILIFTGTWFLIIESDMFVKMNQDKSDAMEWIRKNTSPSSSVYVYLEQRYIKTKTINEIFMQKFSDVFFKDMPFFSHCYVPAYANRTVYTYIGYVWSLDSKRHRIYREFAQEYCAENFFKVSLRHKVYPDYIVLEKYSKERKHTDNFCNDFIGENFRNVFENDKVRIIKVEY
ncbi:hypothetical protein GF327_00515 [Candidatus Woesearchaeota archaeon]|nr:hypothetical protein [Candidatus Woesearchaeota archaeon]